eukprot:6209245-Pleurochrysis_carterae.AAC.2
MRILPVRAPLGSRAVTKQWVRTRATARTWRASATQRRSGRGGAHGSGRRKHCLLACSHDESLKSCTLSSKRKPAMADDAMYALVLLASLAAGAVLYSGMVPIQARAAFSAGIGVLVLCLCCQTQAIHAFFPAAMVLLVIMLLPKYLHGKLCLSISIGYLALARNLQLGAFTNAVLLILTLKLMSIGFDSQDGKLSSRSPILILQYLFCFNGMLTGPFYRFTAWEEVLVLPRTGHVRKSPPGAVARALARTIAAVAIWRGVAVFLPFSAVYDPSFGKATLLYRCMYAYLSCFQFRCAVHKALAMPSPVPSCMRGILTF